LLWSRYQGDEFDNFVEKYYHISNNIVQGDVDLEIYELNKGVNPLPLVE
jgi:hypothetical protein